MMGWMQSPSASSRVWRSPALTSHTRIPSDSYGRRQKCVVTASNMDFEIKSGYCTLVRRGTVLGDSMWPNWPWLLLPHENNFNTDRDKSSCDISPWCHTFFRVAKADGITGKQTLSIYDECKVIEKMAWMMILQFSNTVVRMCDVSVEKILVTTTTWNIVVFLSN